MTKDKGILRTMLVSDRLVRPLHQHTRHLIHWFIYLFLKNDTSSNSMKR
jgi:hypothetical protein